MDDDETNETGEAEEPMAVEPGPEAADQAVADDDDKDVEGFYLDPNTTPLVGVSEQQSVIDVGPDPSLLLRAPRSNPPKYRKLGKHL